MQADIWHQRLGMPLLPRGTFPRRLLLCGNAGAAPQPAQNRPKITYSNRLSASHDDEISPALQAGYQVRFFRAARLFCRQIELAQLQGMAAFPHPFSAGSLTSDLGNISVQCCLLLHVEILTINGPEQLCSLRSPTAERQQNHTFRQRNFLNTRCCRQCQRTCFSCSRHSAQQQ